MDTREGITREVDATTARHHGAHELGPFAGDDRGGGSTGARAEQHRPSDTRQPIADGPRARRVEPGREPHYVEANDPRVGIDVAFTLVKQVESKRCPAGHAQACGEVPVSVAVPTASAAVCEDDETLRDSLAVVVRHAEVANDLLAAVARQWDVDRILAILIVDRPRLGTIELAGGGDATEQAQNVTITDG